MLEVIVALVPNTLCGVQRELNLQKASSQT